MQGGLDGSGRRAGWSQHRAHIGLKQQTVRNEHHQCGAQSSLAKNVPKCRHHRRMPQVVRFVTATRCHSRQAGPPSLTRIRSMWMFRRQRGFLMLAAPNTARKMAQHWTNRAFRFDAAASHVRNHNEWRDVLSTALGNEPRDLVDLGCGTGACALLAAELGHRVTAVDGSEGMLSYARREAEARNLDITFVQSVMDEAELEPASADIVTLRNVLWTLEKPEGALRLAARLLRPGGTVLISDGLWFAHRENRSAEEFGAHLPFFNGLSEVDAKAILDTAGFNTVRSWQHLFESNPYGLMYDDTSRPIDFFVLTASKAR